MFRGMVNDEPAAGFHLPHSYMAARKEVMTII